jgi:hypothetical protein
MTIRRQLRALELAAALGAVAGLTQVSRPRSPEPYLGAALTGALIALGVALVLLLAWRVLRPRRATAGVVPAWAREAIPERVRHEVWRRDRGTCVECGSRGRLEFDHIIPVSRGGANTVRNLELRCEPCNRRKGARV